MYKEFIDQLLYNPSIRKNSTAYLSKKYMISITDVSYLRSLDETGLRIFISEYENELKHDSSNSFKLENTKIEKEEIKKEEPSFLSDLLEKRGVDKSQVTPTSMWIKDPKSRTSTFYSIHAKVQEEPLDLSSIKEELKKEVSPVSWDEPKIVNKSLLIYLSDLHIGMMCATDQLLNSNTYDAKVLEERLFRTLSIILSTKPDEIIICLMGDLVDGWDGETVRKGHKLPQNLNNKEQYHTFINSFKTYFTTLSSLNCKIKFYSVSEGNHEGDLSHIYASSLELWLNAKFPQIETKVFNRFIDFIRVQDHVFMLTHGKDKQEMNKGLPLSLDFKTENFISRFMLDNNIVPNKQFVHFIKGDLHQSSQQYGELFRYRNTLALASPSKWVQTNFLSKTCGVSFDVVEGENVFSSEIFFQ